MREQQGLDASMDIRTERQAEQGATAAESNSFGQILEGQSVVVRKNSGGAEVVQPRLNLIEGANISITLVDDPVNSEADVAISATVPIVPLNYAENGAPGAGQDNTQGYSVNSLGTDTGGPNSYICVDASTGAAVWLQIT